MVAHPRKALRADQLRTLNQPRPLKVACNGRGEPVALSVRGRRKGIDSIKDCWRLDDEWWRAPVSRLYFLVELQGGTLQTVFCDLESGAWYQQRENPGDGSVR